MDRAMQWQLILNAHQSPCFVADGTNQTILYANDAYMNVIGEDKPVVGQKFFKVIVNDDESFEDADLLPFDWENQEVVHHTVFNQKLNIHFYSQHTFIPELNLIVCILTPTEESKVFISLFENAMSRCMEICGQEPETVLLSFMELLCGYYESERAYVFRIDRKEEKISCIAQWAQDPKYRVVQEAGTKMNANMLIQWIQSCHEKGIVMGDLNDDLKETDVLYQIIHKFQVKNVTFCTIEDANHQVVGIVGLSNRAHYRRFFDSRLIHTISRFVAQDVTKKMVDATLFQLHHRDILTGLYNRAGYARRIEQIMDERPKTLGVISMNVNGLKSINDKLGISGGDEHIQRSARRLKEYFSYDTYRMSGDEFLVVAPNVNEEEFESKVKSLHDSLREEQNYDFSFGHSFGKGSYQLTYLITEADTVMYINKQEYYSASKREHSAVNDNTLSDLLSYLADGEFMVYLQPQVVLEDGSLYGAEALIRRFDKKNQKMVFPDQFISLYEKKSVIRHVDIFVLETVCKLLKEWGEEAIPISVNFSRVTLQEYGIVKTISDICDKYEVPHHLVVIEVTERVGLIENNVASTLIQEFKDKKFHISLDDFGCAYSNIVTLAQIEVDEVKIDKSLVDYIMTNSKNRVLVKNVLAMCNELEGASTLAEGIEDEEQAQLLQKLGCRLGQGYYYSRPIPVEEFCEKYGKK